MFAHTTTRKSLSSVQVRQFAHGYPPSVRGVAKTVNFGHFSTDFDTYPKWKKGILEFLYKIKFDVYMTNLMGYRKMDILAETPSVATALERIPGEVMSDRDDRIKEALVVGARGDQLPPECWATAAEDKAYMAPYLEQVMQEQRDREAFRPR